MGKPQTQKGYVYESNNAFHVRYYVRESGVTKQKSYKLCTKDETHPSKDAPAFTALAETFMVSTNDANSENANQAGHRCPLCNGRCTRTIEHKFASRV